MALLAGPVGTLIIGWSGLAIFLLVMMSGVWAWWPQMSGRDRWAKALRYSQRSALTRRLRDIHKLAGLIGLPLLSVLVVTGVMLALPDQSNAALRPLFGPVDPSPKAMDHAATGPRMSITQAAAITQRVLPSARIVWIEVTPIGQGVYKFRMRTPHDPSARFPHSSVFLDPVSGRVVAVQNADRAGSATTINNWLHGLHDASVLGLFTRWLAVMIGLVPALLFSTGLWRWIVRHRAAKRSVIQ